LTDAALEPRLSSSPFTCPDPGQLAEMGHRARAMLDAHFTQRHAFASWQTLIEDIAQAPPRID
jgi:hypothetical protein